MLKNIEKMESFFGSETLFLELFTIFIIAIILNFIAKFFIIYLKKASKKTKNNWDDALVYAAEKPLFWIIWLVALKLSFDIISVKFYGRIFAESLIALRLFVVLNISWFLVRIVDFVSKNLIKSAKVSGKEADFTTIDAVSKLSKLTIIVLSVLVLMQNLGFSISGILAAGGVGGLVVGFAAKDMLANLFGGLTIYLDRPFSVGDWIRSPDKQIEGSVEYIGWRQTRIRAFNKNPIYVPNSVFTTIIVENPSRMSHRRINEIIGLRYCDIGKMQKITSEIHNFLDNHEEIDQNETKIVNFTEFADSSINFLVNVFLKNIDRKYFHNVKQEILLEIAKIIEKNGAEIAFPTRTLHIDSNN